MEFGARLKIFREKKGLSVKELSKMLSISASTYREWEYGRNITGNPYLKISSALEVSLNELFGVQTIKYKEVENAINEVKTRVNKLEKICKSFS